MQKNLILVELQHLILKVEWIEMNLKSLSDKAATKKIFIWKYSLRPLSNASQEKDQFEELFMQRHKIISEILVKKNLFLFLKADLDQNHKHL